MHKRHSNEIHAFIMSIETPLSLSQTILTTRRSNHTNRPSRPVGTRCGCGEGRAHCSAFKFHQEMRRLIPGRRQIP